MSFKPYRARRVVRGVLSCALFALASCVVEVSDAPQGREIGVAQQALGPSPDTDCEFFSSAGRDYWFCSTERNWQTARTKCQAIGLDLATIETSTENTFIRSHLPDDSWIGANDITVEGTWRWASTGTQFWQGTYNGSAVGGAYTNWSTLQPSSSSEDCAIIDDASSAKWSDVSCSGNREYVCEGVVDLCPSDPNKVVPGQCGCGSLDTDGDNDGTANCNDECPTDPTMVTEGDCGCSTDPEPAGLPCNDGLCAGSTQCDGFGACGAPSDCSPPDTACTAHTFEGTDYWFCSNQQNYATSSSKCSAKGFRLVRIDNQSENSFVVSHAGNDAWIGANDSAVEGAWVWEINGDQFWSGNGGGTPVGNLYSQWSSGQPNDLGGEDCAQLSGSNWLDDDCADTEPYVCERLDECPTDEDKFSPGACGCGFPDTDSDMDATPDCLDSCGDDPTSVAPGPVCGCGCSGHGTCIQDNPGEHCVCDADWTGSDCSDSTDAVTGSDAIDAILPTNAVGAAVLAYLDAIYASSSASAEAAAVTTLQGLPAADVIQTLRTSYLGSHDGHERGALILTGAVINHADAVILFDDVLGAAVPPEFIDFDPHQRDLAREVTVLMNAVGGLARLVTQGISQARNPLLDTVTHPISAVRRYAVYRIMKTGDSQLISDMQSRLSPDDASFLLLRTATAGEMEPSETPPQPADNEPGVGETAEETEGPE